MTRPRWKTIRTDGHGLQHVTEDARGVPVYRVKAWRVPDEDMPHGQVAAERERVLGISRFERDCRALGESLA